MKDEIIFSTSHLTIGGEVPMMKIFEYIPYIKEDSFKLKETLYLITIENIDNNYLWLYVKFGKKTPYSGTVTHMKTYKKEKNPRNEDQIETDKQLFGLYSIEDNIFYLSSSKKKSLFEKYLGGKTKQEVTIKHLFKSPKEFVEQIKNVRQVEFTVRRNLFNEESGIMDILPNPKDLFGLGVP